jgi:hypothetical protein
MFARQEFFLRGFNAQHFEAAAREYDAQVLAIRPLNVCLVLAAPTFAEQRVAARDACGDSIS